MDVRSRRWRDRARREGARRDDQQQRLRRDHPRHVPRPAERLHLRDDAGGDRVRRTDHPRGRGGRHHTVGAEPRAGRLDGRIQPQLGRQLAGDDLVGLARLVCGVPDSLLDASLRRRRVADLGTQHCADDPAEERGVVLVVHSAAVQPLSHVAGGDAGEHRGPGAQGGDGHTVRPRLGAARFRERAQGALSGGVGSGPQVWADAEPHARPHVQHRLRTGGGRRAAHEPHPVPALLSREAPVLPGECRCLLGGDAAGGGAVLQPQDRDRRRGAGADHRRGAGDGTRGEHDDRGDATLHRRCAARRHRGAVVHGAAGVARSVAPLAHRGDRGAAHDDRQHRQLQPHAGGRRAGGAGRRVDDRLVGGGDQDAGAHRRRPRTQRAGGVCHARLEQ